LSKSPASLVELASLPDGIFVSLAEPHCLFTFHRKGRFLFQYDNYGSTAEDIVEWLKK
jgi:hypothetical protein